MQKKKIIITGANSGIGMALAEHFSLLGHHVVAVARSQGALEKLQHSFASTLTIVIADVTKQDDRLKIKISLSSEDTGVLLVHCAGIAIPRLLAEITEQEWDQHYFTNTKAPLFINQILLPHLKNGGRVLTVSSGLAHTPSLAMAAYGISKAALLMTKEYLNSEFGSQDIHFASAMPGVVDTPIQTYLRSCDSKRFPAVGAFHGFFQRGELLQPTTAAKFLAWLLLNVDNEQFTRGDWNIYDVSHHHYWAQPGEVIQRKKTDQELIKLQEQTQGQRVNHNITHAFYFMCIVGIIAIIASARFVSHNITAEVDAFSP